VAVFQSKLKKGAEDRCGQWPSLKKKSRMERTVGPYELSALKDRLLSKVVSFILAFVA
jgi:hypothetical protein